MRLISWSHYITTIIDNEEIEKKIEPSMLNEKEQIQKKNF